MTLRPDLPKSMRVMSAAGPRIKGIAVEKSTDRKAQPKKNLVIKKVFLS